MKTALDPTKIEIISAYDHFSGSNTPFHHQEGVQARVEMVGQVVDEDDVYLYVVTGGCFLQDGENIQELLESEQIDTFTVVKAAIFSRIPLVPKEKS